MKRKLSLLMALMMVVALLPMSSAFAASRATVTQRTVGEDSRVTMELVISQEGALDFDTTGEFRVILEGNDATFVTSGGAYLVNTGAGPYNVSAPLPGSTSRELVLSPTAAGGPMTIVAEIQLDRAQGEQRVRIEEINANVSNQTLTYAVVAGRGNIVARTIENKESISRGLAAQQAARFEIREVTNNAFTRSAGNANTTLTLRLPSGFTWDASTTVEGALNGGSHAIDNRNLTITVNDDPALLQRLVVTPFVRVARDARLGDVEVEISSNNTQLDRTFLTIAEARDFGVTVEVDRVLEIVAGRNRQSSDYRSRITLNANTNNSFLNNREIELTFSNRIPSLSSVSEAQRYFRNATVTHTNANSSGASKVFITADNVDRDIVIEPFLFAAWDKGGTDLTLNVKGGGVEEQTVTLAKILAPATIATQLGTKEVADVVIGLFSQDAPEITLTETMAGSLAEGNYVIDFTDDRFGVTFEAGMKIEVLEGDIEVDIDRSSNRQKLVITIEEESRVPSTIKISGIKVSLDRTVPFGNLEARFARMNSGRTERVIETLDNSSTTFGAIRIVDASYSKIANFDLINVVTAAPDARKQTSVFTIGSVNYTVGEETRTLDAAPYISNNRTMLPIGTVAQLVGATVNYSAETRTAVFTKDNLVVSMNLDTNVLLVNGSPVAMDAKPEIQNSRAFVPVVFVAQAFGIQNNTDIVYDATARTVTLFPNAQ